ncbi:hypothetical protein [Sphingobacterium griseoflavum]|uniref:Uncharacterized protein n=1 Tax=Sphingobacterium griseoflavum TaxID=1474952 RepID=A0ABQ3HQM1_9SPHI|nr:hypothetical protein [Sphingobacterium griseoflavum]GHE23575.1 hypothetical protein GCM10017764_05430 [Sphingobacterium griseoflavum]
MNKYARFGGLLFLVTVLGFGIHTLLLQNLGLNAYWKQTHYTLMGMYAFGCIASLTVATFLLLADFAMKNYVSIVFLGCILIKAVASYLFIQSGLNLFENDFLELNFLGVFFIFLMYDILVAYRLVNQEVKVVEK